MPKTLHLTLTYHWWDKVSSGEKMAEYRRSAGIMRNVIMPKGATPAGSLKYGFPRAKQ